MIVLSRKKGSQEIQVGNMSTLPSFKLEQTELLQHCLRGVQPWKHWPLRAMSSWGARRWDPAMPPGALMWSIAPFGRIAADNSWSQWGSIFR